MPPIATDPKVTIGRGIYVRYNKSETKRLVNGKAGAINDKLKYAAILCAPLATAGTAGAAAAAGCAYYVYDVSSSIVRTAKDAAAKNQCFELVYIYVGTASKWKGYPC